MYSTSASIDSNRVVDCKVIADDLTVSFRISVLFGCLYILTSPVESCKPSNSRFCYMVKPHEQLVLVSSTLRSASTPNLSTS